MTLIDRPVQLSDRPSEPPPRRPWRRWQITLIIIAALVVGGLIGTGGLLWYYAQNLPDLGQLQNYQPSLVTQVYSSDQRLIGQFFIERRILTPLPQIPEHLRRAVIAVEDVQAVQQGLWSWRTVRDVMRPASTDLFISPDASMMQAMERMVRTGYDRLVVLDEGRPVGLVTRSGVAQFLQLHKS